MPKLCKCGCGTEIPEKNTYVQYHYFTDKEYQEKMSKSLTGRKISENHRIKLSLSKKGVPQPWILGDKNPFYGKHHTLETKEAISFSRIGRFLGPNNPNWKNGSSHLPYPEEFNEDLKEEIREIYNRICPLCGKNEEENKAKLSVHHIDFNKKNLLKDNLIPLCKSCHILANIGDIKKEKLINIVYVYLYIVCCSNPLKSIVTFEKQGMVEIK